MKHMSSSSFSYLFLAPNSSLAAFFTLADKYTAQNYIMSGPVNRHNGRNCSLIDQSMVTNGGGRSEWMPFIFVVLNHFSNETQLIGKDDICQAT